MSSLNGPRQAILVTSSAEVKVMGIQKEKDNIITLAWHMPVSHNPNLYAIALGKQRFSTGIIQKSKCFAVNFMPAELEKEILLCGRKSGISSDKFKLCSFRKVECTTIECPRIKEAIGYLECELVQEIEAGDHIIFIGKVLKSELSEDKKRLFNIKDDIFTTTKR